MARFRYLGCMGMKIERRDGFKIVVDPYIKGYEMAVDSVDSLYDADLVVVTHAAFDHFGDTVEILKNSDAKLLAGDEVLAMVKEEHEDIDPERLCGTVYGGIHVFGETVIRTVAAWHCSAVMRGGVRLNYNPFGYMIQVEEQVTYYHTGDTCLFADMELLGKVFRPDVMMVGISNSVLGYSGEMTPEEAAMAVEMVSSNVVIPSHYLKGDGTLERFMDHIKVRAPHTKVLSSIGRTFEYVPFKIIQEQE